jgi:hypothetical protein
MVRINGWSVLLLGASLSFQIVLADDAVDAALRQTQECLRNNNCESATTVEGKAAAQQALSAVGGDVAKQQGLNNLAADIMPILVQQSGGDPQKMQELMLKAQTNPEQFINSLPLNLQAQIKNAAIAAENKQ